MKTYTHYYYNTEKTEDKDVLEVGIRNGKVEAFAVTVLGGKTFPQVLTFTTLMNNIDVSL